MSYQEQYTTSTAEVTESFRKQKKNTVVTQYISKTGSITVISDFANQSKFCELLYNILLVRLSAHQHLFISSKKGYNEEAKSLDRSVVFR